MTTRSVLLAIKKGGLQIDIELGIQSFWILSIIRESHRTIIYHVGIGMESLQCQSVIYILYTEKITPNYKDAQTRQ